jgi:hypothetical protein
MKCVCVQNCITRAAERVCVRLLNMDKIQWKCRVYSIKLQGFRKETSRTHEM